MRGYLYELGTLEKPVRDDSYFEIQRASYWNSFDNHTRTAYASIDYQGATVDLNIGMIHPIDETEESNSYLSAHETLFSLTWPEDNWIINDIAWSDDDKILYFDNHGQTQACIWRYDLKTGQLEKIVPEH